MIPLTPAQSLALADQMCRNHAAVCPRCEPPAVERSNAGCPEGHVLAAQWAARWRARMDAMSGRSR